MRFAVTSLFIATLSLLATTGCRTRVGVDPNAPTPLPLVVDGVRTSYADVVEKTSPAVVRIDAERRTNAAPQQFPFDDDFFKDLVPQQRQPRQQIERGVGSGVLVSGEGTVLTNHHVIDGADKITVTMQDNRRFTARIVGSDQPSDLAVLKVEGADLPFLNLGNSDNVRVGDIVLAIGNPLGIGQTVTAGIISAKGRQTGLSDGTFEDFLQTDAPINRGNSGGALVNLSGELIGINSQILSPSGGNIGIGFSIPSNMAKSVMDQLVNSGKVKRGMLGVNIQDLTEDVAKSLELGDVRGVLINNVRPGSAAEKAGLRRGDVITAINGEKVDSGNVLRNKIAASQPGSQISLTVFREGKEFEVKATLDEFDSARNESEGAPRGDAAPAGKLGLSLRPLTPELAQQAGAPKETQGLLVVEVDDGGAAAEAGMSHGDIILEINKRAVTTLEAAEAAIQASGAKPVLLLILRGGRTSYLTVQPR